MAVKPRWSWIEIILVYMSIMVIGFIVSRFSGQLAAIGAELGMGEVGYFLVTYLIQFLTTILLVWFFGTVTTKASWSDLGLRPASVKKFLYYGLLGGIVLIVVVVILGIIIKQIQPDLSPQYYEEMLRSARRLPVFLLVFVAGAVLAPLSEELYYRGMIYPVFRERFGPVWGAIMAGSLFGLAHFDLWRTIPLAIGGAGLCYIYEKSDSIWVSTLAHGVWNGFMSIAVYLSISNGLL